MILWRENCDVCLSEELQQIECTLTDDVTRLAAVRNKNILCQFSCSSLVPLQSGALLMSGMRLLVVKAGITYYSWKK